MKKHSRSIWCGSMVMLVKNEREERANREPK